MKDCIKVTIEGTNPETGEKITQVIEGEVIAVTALGEKVEDKGIPTTNFVLGTINNEGVMSLLRGLRSAQASVLNNIPKDAREVILKNMMMEMLLDLDDTEEDN